MEELEARVENLERALGLPEHQDAKTEDVDVDAIRRSLVERGCRRIFTVPIDKLKRLHDITHKAELRPISEKLNTIQFCEELIRQRAESLKQFEEALQVVMDSESIAAVGQHDAALVAVTSEVEEALRSWKECSSELDDLRDDLTALFTTMHSTVADLERRVAEKKK